MTLGGLIVLVLVVTTIVICAKLKEQNDRIKKLEKGEEEEK